MKGKNFRLIFKGENSLEMYEITDLKRAFGINVLAKPKSTYNPCEKYHALMVVNKHEWDVIEKMRKGESIKIVDGVGGDLPEPVVSYINTKGK